MAEALLRNICPGCGAPNTLGTVECVKCGQSFERGQRSSRVTLVGVNIPFGDLVALMVKLGIAALPAAVLLAVFWGFITAFISAVLLGGIAKP